MEKRKKARILFVSPRYGLEVNGGAEMECRAYAEHLTGRFDVSVLTTCAVDHMTWKNEYEQGESRLNGVRVIRVKNEKEREQKSFNRFIAKVIDPSHTREDEVEFVDRQGPYCPKLISYLEAHKDEYDAILFVTYLYYHVVYGTLIEGVPKILIPTVHDEWVAHLSIVQDVFQNVDGYIYNTDEEKVFADRQYPGAGDKPSCTVGYGIEVPNDDVLPDVKQKYGLDNYIMYAGRIEEAKGCGHLFTYFMEYKKHHNGDLKLVLCGKSGMEIPKRDDIVSLGFVDDLDKYALMKNARVFVLASHFESLSIVVLESMMMGTPVLVNGACAVLKGHCLKSNAGLYFVNYTQFERTLTWLLTHPGEYEQMRENGRDYVKKNYQWPLITDRIVGLIEQVIADRKTAEKNSDPKITGR